MSNHAGISLSYTQAIAKLKKLGLERLEQTRKIAHTCAFMIIWDSLNIAFKVREQRHDSKDHFDNGTTATLVPLYGVEYGGLPAPLKPKRERRNTILDINPEDLVPTGEEATCVQFGQLWTSSTTSSLHSENALGVPLNQRRLFSRFQCTKSSSRLSS